jgi:7,8-dihydroneopterin aldolase/epimerase/oxygenase
MSVTSSVDRVRLVGMSFYGYHGVSAAEKETGRMFEIDCEMAVDLVGAGRSDRLADTVDYEKVFRLIKETVEGQAFSLLEGLAQRLAARLMKSFEVDSVTLRVRKMNPPIAGHIRYVEVELTRRRDQIG